MSAVRVLSAADAARAAERVRQQVEQRKDWPYEHIFPPPSSIPVNSIYYNATFPGFAAVPAAGASVTVAYYQVPEGFRFIMQAILQSYEGTFNPGDTLWTLNRNAAGGAQANLVQGLIQVPVPLGSWKNGTQWYFDRAYEFMPFDVLTSVAKNVNLNPGPPNYYVSGFMGYLLPTEGL